MTVALCTTLRELVYFDAFEIYSNVIARGFGERARLDDRESIEICYRQCTPRHSVIVCHNLAGRRINVGGDGRAGLEPAGRGGGGGAGVGRERGWRDPVCNVEANFTVM